MSSTSGSSLDLQSQSFSVLVPTSNRDAWSQECLKQICRSIELCRVQSKELVLVVDREVFPGDFLWDLRIDFDFVRLLYLDPDLRGTPRARSLAIRSAKYPLLLFTTDDCRVPDLWVEQVVRLILVYGVVSGRVIGDRSRPNGLIQRMEEKWDELRAGSRGAQGGGRYVSFSCLGIHRQFLPMTPFDPLFVNSADDLDLSYRLQLSRIRIFHDPSLQVQRRYPQSIFALLALKWRQAQGVTWVHQRFGIQRLQTMGITHWTKALRCWVEYSFRVDFPYWARIPFLAINVFYCIGLAYFAFIFRGVAPAQENEVIHVPHLTTETNTNSQSISAQNPSTL